MFQKVCPLIHFAVEKRDVEIVSALLSVPIIWVNQKDRHGSTPIHIAVSEKRRIETVNDLLRSTDIDVHQKDNFGKTPLELAVRIGYIIAVIALLSIPGILAHESEEYGQNLLKCAIENNHQKCITILQKAMKKKINRYYLID